MSNLIPEEGFLRVRQIVGDRKANPPIPAIIPVSQSTWWAGVASGRFPQPIRLSRGVTVWRVEDIRSLLENPPTELESGPAKAQAAAREKHSGRYSNKRWESRAGRP
ncbi:MAG: hypothetical protein LBH14_00355 [Desulfobulbaceae bacterium]|nr:hypothetical protein [Desulfobulbaceae bacterium]